nr:3-methyl-2-oxobutanoate hydroxymethyltransferase [uncultured Fretibacterium sp.]
MFAETAGLDMILVGDSLGMVVPGYPGTIPVTILGAFPQGARLRAL